MEAIRALIYSAAIFAALVVIALIVAGIMKLLYSIVHQSEKHPPAVDPGESKSTSE